MSQIEQNKGVTRVGSGIDRFHEGGSSGPRPGRRNGWKRLVGRMGVAGAVVGAVFSLLLDGGCGCGGEHPDNKQGATETDGVVTTGVEGGGSVDETGVEIPYYCVYDDESSMGFVGVKHQCRLEYDLNITFTVNPPIGPSFQVPLAITGVRTADDSTYEHPFVMACCTDVTTQPDWPFDDSCSYLHHKACLSDFIEHICDAPGVWLEQASHDFPGQGAEAIEGASKWFKDHRQDCYDHFWTGPDDLFSADPCAPEFDGFFDHTPWEPTESWAYVVGNSVIAEVSDVVVAPRSSLGQSVPLAPPSPAQSCTAPDSNNGETPPLSGPVGGGTIVSPTAPVSIDVQGPKLADEVITGSGAFGTDSVLQWRIADTGALELERWTMVEHAATTVGTTSIRASVDGFKLDLLDARKVAAIPGGWEIGAEAALFNLIATVDGVGSNVQAANATPIKLSMLGAGMGACPTHVRSCLVSRPFRIDYEDAFGQSWELDIPATTWMP